MHNGFDIIKFNPDYLQSYFILGYLFYKKIKNVPQAFVHFENYNKRSKSKRYSFLNKRVDSYLPELKQWMDLE